jgi:hypothetical protein
MHVTLLGMYTTSTSASLCMTCQLSHVTVHEAYQMIIQKAHCYIIILLKISSEVGNRVLECVYHLHKEVTILYTYP